jgi:hypothetical protein
MASGIPTVLTLLNQNLMNKRGNIISTALFISSSMKLLPILTAIWEYDVPASARAVGWAVVVNNIEALTSLTSLSVELITSSSRNDIPEYFHVILTWCIDTCVNRLDDTGLDDVGRRLGEACNVSSEKTSSRRWGVMELAACLERCRMGVLEGN